MNLNLLSHLPIFQQKLTVRKRNPLKLIGLFVLLIVGYTLLWPSTRLPIYAKELDRNENHIIYSKHAKCRMGCRHIDKSEVIEILRKGTIDYKKSNLKYTTTPTYVVEGITHDEQHVRIIFAPVENGIVVVTVIDLKQEWQCACD